MLGGADADGAGDGAEPEDAEVYCGAAAEAGAAGAGLCGGRLKTRRHGDGETRSDQRAVIRGQ